MTTPATKVCPVCGDRFPIAGPQGVLRHILDEHPASDFAASVRRELAAMAAEGVGGR